MLRLHGGKRLRFRTAKTLVALGAVLALASIAAGSALADVELSVSPDQASYFGSFPDGQDAGDLQRVLGWYVHVPVAGQITLGEPSRNFQAAKDITCRQSTDNAVVGTFASDQTGPFLVPGPAVVSIALTGENLHWGGGVEVNCTGTLLQARTLLDCTPDPQYVKLDMEDPSCPYIGFYREAGPIVWHVGSWLIDRSPPTDVAVTAETGPNANGWYNAPASVQLTGTDEQSGIRSCTIKTTDEATFTVPLNWWTAYGLNLFNINLGPQSFNPEAQSIAGPDGKDKQILAWCTNAAGSSTAGHPAGFDYNYDSTKPTISGAATTSPNSNGWYKSSVDVQFTCDDNLSGIASCPADETLADEGAGVHSTAQTATDNADNVSDPSNVVEASIDKTAPGVTCGPTPTYVLGSGGNSVSATVTDGLSRPAASSVSAAAPTTALGLHSADVTGSDKAGNSRTVSCPYIVGYGYTFLSPQPNQVSQANLGIKFQLTNNAGVPISDSEAASLVGADCKIQVSFVIGGAVSGCPAYNPSLDRFEFTVKTTKALQGANGVWVTVKAGSTVLLTTAVVPVTIK